VVGEYDEFDEYNAGVRWRVFDPKKKDLPRAASEEPKKKEAGNAPAR
jgi:translocation and assembly module TamB